MTSFVDQCRQTYADLTSARADRLEAECCGYLTEESLFLEDSPVVRYSDVIRMVAAEWQAEREAAELIRM